MAGARVRLQAVRTSSPHSHAPSPVSHTRLQAPRAIAAAAPRRQAAISEAMQVRGGRWEVVGGGRSAVGGGRGPWSLHGRARPPPFSRLPLQFTTQARLAPALVAGLAAAQLALIPGELSRSHAVVAAAGVALHALAKHLFDRLCPTLPPPTPAGAAFAEDAPAPAAPPVEAPAPAKNEAVAAVAEAPSPKADAPKAEAAKPAAVVAKAEAPKADKPAEPAATVASKPADSPKPAAPATPVAVVASASAKAADEVAVTAAVPSSSYQVRCEERRDAPAGCLGCLRWLRARMASCFSDTA